jgi:hypothetical protein
VIDPDVVVRTDREAADLADTPVIRQRLRPGRIDDETRRLDAGGQTRLGALGQAIVEVRRED